ncbi:MAG: hypothetical protein JKY09_03725 [Crocinitomicaceae bacterium]|nr:hypothetical protein [Crocinitomicaceae bacterium]
MDNEFLDRAQLEDIEAAETNKQKKKKSKAKASKQRKPSAFVQILNGDFLTKEFMVSNLNFIFFIILLLLLIVGKGYYGKQLSKDVVNTQKELDEATSDFFEAKARLEENTRRIKLVDELASSGLRETVNPVKVIRIKEEESE